MLSKQSPHWRPVENLGVGAPKAPLLVCRAFKHPCPWAEHLCHFNLNVSLPLPTPRAGARQGPPNPRAQPAIVKPGPGPSRSSQVMISPASLYLPGRTRGIPRYDMRLLTVWTGRTERARRACVRKNQMEIPALPPVGHP